MVGEVTQGREVISGAVLKAESFTTAGFVQSKVFRSCRFIETDFFSIRFEQCAFHDCAFENVDMSGSFFRHCSFEDCTVARSNFNHSRFESCDFGANGKRVTVSSSNFTQAEFGGQTAQSRMNQTKFEHCSLDFAAFTGFEEFRLEFVDCNLQQALIERCRAERLDLRTCSTRGLQLRDNNFNLFQTYKEKFIRIIGVAALIGATDLEVDGDMLRLGKSLERSQLAATIAAIQTLRDEAEGAARLFEQTNAEIILRTLCDRHVASGEKYGSIAAQAVATQVGKHVIGINIQISDVTLTVLALEAANELDAEDINVLAQLGIAILGYHRPADIELGRHILVVNRVASKLKLDRYEITLTLRGSDDFSPLVDLSNALIAVSPEGVVTVEALARGSTKAVLSANSKGFLIVVLILLKLGVSVKYANDGSFHFNLSFDGNLSLTDGTRKIQYDQHRGDVTNEEVEKRVKKLRSSRMLPVDLGQLEAEAGELSAVMLPSVRSFAHQAMLSRDSSKGPPRLASASPERSSLLPPNH